MNKTESKGRQVRWLAGVMAAAATLGGPLMASLPLPDNGGEFTPTGNLPGDQILPSIAIDSKGGILAWQDNRAASTAGIYARSLNADLVGFFSSFQVNSTSTGLHQEPQVVRFPNGGAAFFWLGGPVGRQTVLGRFMKPGAGSPSFWGTDVLVNLDGAFVTQAPKAAVGADGNVVVVWTSPNGDLDGSGVLAQRFSPTGTRLGSSFLVNQGTLSNQRNPSIAALSGGNFVVTWISENQRFVRSMDLFGRVFGGDGTPQGGEFRVNFSTNMCAAGAVAALPGGGFAAAWPEYDLENSDNSWDVHSRIFDGRGVSSQPSVVVNSTLVGKQIEPQIAVVGSSVMISWTAIGQNSINPQIFARGMTLDGSPLDVETPLNQLGPLGQQDLRVAATEDGQLMAVWTSFQSVANGWDLAARRFSAVAVQPGVTASVSLVSGAVQLSWPTVIGAVYQVQTGSTPMNLSNFQGQRTAAGATDSLSLPMPSNAAFYRVLRIR